MREHEVPTHVQAEDRVLLWFTFPQIVALTAVCALSYGAYRYAPIGPAEVRIGLAVVMGLVGRPWWWARWVDGGCPWWRPTCCGSGWGHGVTPGPRPSWCAASHHRRCRRAPPARCNWRCARLGPA